MSDDFPNDWDAVNDMPDEVFRQVPYEEFVSLRADSWSIPSSVDCIVRVKNLRTGLVSEKSFKTRTQADDFVQTILLPGDLRWEFFIVDQEELTYFETAENTDD